MLLMDQRSSELCSVSSTDFGFNVFFLSEAVYSDYIIVQLFNLNPEKSFDLIGLYGRVYLI